MNIYSHCLNEFSLKCFVCSSKIMIRKWNERMKLNKDRSKPCRINISFKLLLIFKSNIIFARYVLKILTNYNREVKIIKVR